jgi:hypothetical protein
VLHVGRSTFNVLRRCAPVPYCAPHPAG